MARRITWVEPDNTNITKVDIHRSASLYGTYSQVEEIDATSDGNAKSSSNTWVTEYLDVNGSLTDWYKIRFYDGTNSVYSEFSDPITSEELVGLCSVADVKNVLETTGRWTDDEIFETIKEVDDMIYIECGTPIQAVWSVVGKIDDTIQRTYYVGEENVHRIDRVFYGTTTKHEYFLDDGYKANLKYGMIRFLPVASGGPDMETTDEVEVHYVPKLYHKLSLYRTIVQLLEQTDTTSGGEMSKELEVARKRLENIERILNQRIGLQVSSSLKYYDSLYGVNRKKINQDHDRNNYIGSYGW